jgi:hypothetical protein
MNSVWVRCKFYLCYLQHTNLFCIAIIVQQVASFSLKFYFSIKAYSGISIST